MADPHLLLLLRLLLVFLGVCNLIFSNPVPPATSRNLMHGQDRAFQTAFGETKVAGGGGRSRGRKVEIELNDYPGSGANNRHTPRPPFARGCLDC